MRTISDAALAKILQTQGTDPITLVQIFWQDGVSIIYGDRAFLPEIRGQLLDVAEIESVVNASEGSNSGSVPIRLSDTSGELKAIFDNMDIHKKTVYILQWFHDLPLADAFVVFDGVISSPVEWKEGDRTLSFEVLTKIEDLEVGYSAEEGNFEYIPDNLVGQAWPMIFGSVLRVQALQVNQIPVGLTNADTGINGATQGPLGNIANNDKLNLTLLYNLKEECFTIAAILLGQASFDPNHGDVFNRRSDDPKVQQLYDLGTQYEAKGNEYLKELQRPFNVDFANPVVDDLLNANQLLISNGSAFPQQTNIIITINGANYNGYFQGDVFNIQGRNHPFTDQTAVVGPTEVVDRAVATEFSTDLAVQTFFYAVAGSSVNVGFGNNYPVYYIVGIPHLTNIVVLAGKTNSGSVKYVVPSSYYTVQYKTYGTLQVTMVVMSQPLSSRGEDWNDEIYCNCTSPIGPNAVDILKHLIDNYTDASYDTTSFASVRADVNIYKCSFAITDRRSAFDLIKDIAYQSRCAIWFKGGRFYIKYLPKVSAAVETFTEDDVESGTLEIFGTDTEEVVTKWQVEWRARLDQNPPNKIVLRYHIGQYGLLEDTYDCYIYNNKASVKKFAIFWLLRRSNTWKKIRFSTFLHKIRVEPFDTVLLNFTYPWIKSAACTESVYGIVEQASYNSDAQRIDMVIWTPIRFGEMCPYQFAYPSDLSETDIFPLDNDVGTDTGVPGAAAEGALYDQTPITGPTGTPGYTEPYSGSGGGTPLADSVDAANPDNFNPPVELSPDSLVTATEPPQVQTVQQRLIKPLDLTSVDLPDGTFPGVVVEQHDGLEYKVDVYLNTLSNEPSRLIVRQLQLDSTDTIPAGTYALVARNTLRNSNGFIERIEYTMQVPIWLEPSADGDTAAPPPVPPSDEGSEPEAPAEPPPQADEGDE